MVHFPPTSPYVPFPKTLLDPLLTPIHIDSLVWLWLNIIIYAYTFTERENATCQFFFFGV